MAGSRSVEQRWPAFRATDTGRLVLFGAVAVLIGLTLVRLAIGVSAPQTALAFGFFIAFGELLRLSLSGGREVAPIAMSGALAYAMTLHVAGLGAGIPRLPPSQVVAVTAIGMALGALPHVAAGRSAGLTGMATRLVVVAIVAFAFRPLAARGLLDGTWLRPFAVMTALVAAGWLTEIVISALIRSEDLRTRFTVALSDEARVQWRIGAAIGACAIIISFGAETMGLAELAVFAAPLLVIQLAFRRYVGIRATYTQTVRSLARVTEVGGYVESGHAMRVARLALAVGRELGMPEHELIDLEYASLMHDIGQLSLRDPIPGGATTVVSAYDQRRIAALGADVIRQAGVLDKVANLVRCQSLPYRPIGVSATEPPLGSRVIRAANTFDDLVAGSGDRDRIGAAVERMRADTDREYDPAVVDALASVVARRPVVSL